MKIRDSRQHSLSLSNNPYPEPNQPPTLIPISSRSILILSSHLCLSLPKGIFPVGLPVKILKALLPSSILATCPVHLNLLDFITLTILGERYKLYVCIRCALCWQYGVVQSIVVAYFGWHKHFNSSLASSMQLHGTDEALPSSVLHLACHPIILANFPASQNSKRLHS